MKTFGLSVFDHFVHTYICIDTHVCRLEIKF